VRDIDSGDEMKKCSVIAMERGYVENAGAIFYHRPGDRHFFHIVRRTSRLHCV